MNAVFDEPLSAKPLPPTVWCLAWPEASRPNGFRTASSARSIMRTVTYFDTVGIICIRHAESKHAQRLLPLRYCPIRSARRTRAGLFLPLRTLPQGEWFCVRGERDDRIAGFFRDRRRGVVQVLQGGDGLEAFLLRRVRLADHERARLAAGGDADSSRHARYADQPTADRAYLCRIKSRLGRDPR